MTPLTRASLDPLRAAVDDLQDALRARQPVTVYLGTAARQSRCLGLLRRLDQCIVTPHLQVTETRALPERPECQLTLHLDASACPQLVALYERCIFGRRPPGALLFVWAQRLTVRGFAIGISLDSSGLAKCELDVSEYILLEKPQ